MPRTLRARQRRRVAFFRIPFVLSALLLLLSVALGPSVAAEPVTAPDKPTTELEGQESNESRVVLTGTVVDRRGVAVACEAAVLVERELVVACSDDGQFQLEVAGGLRPEGESLVVYAPGFRDHIQAVGSDNEPLHVRLRRGRSRRAQTTTRSAPHWRELTRREPKAARGFEVGGASTNPSRHAEAAGGYGDINRTLHGLPGVSGDTAASARLRVRGAERHETLTFIDGIRIQDATHLGGLFGALDPDLTTQVQVDGAAPSAALPDSLGGVIHATYLDRPHDRFDGAIDLSFLGAGAHVAVDLGKNPGQGASLVLGARRSLLQAYLGVFDAIGVTDIPLDIVDFGSAYGRLGLPLGEKSRLRITLLHLHDRALLDDLNLRHRVLGGSLRWDSEPGPRSRLFIELSWSWEEEAEPPTDNVYPGKRIWAEAVHRGRVLAGVEQEFGSASRFRIGIDAGPVLRRARGELFDPSMLPAWAALPQADLSGTALLEDDLLSDHGELDLYGEVELAELGLLDLRFGARISLLNDSLTPRVSPRVALVLPLPTGTILRGSVALTHQDRPDLRLLGAAPERPERGVVATVAVAQELSDVAVFEITTWGRALDHLQVPTGGPTRWAGDGVGLAGGLDLTWMFRLGRFEANAGWSFLGTRRSNPHEDRFRSTVPTGGDQRHDVEVGARLLVGRQRNFTIGLGYSGASGPPASTLSPLQQESGSFLWDLTGLNNRRLVPTHRVDLRLEHRIPTRFFRLRASFEVNADLGGRVFLENCPVEAADGEVPSCGSLTFWPQVRPWLGLKAEW